MAFEYPHGGVIHPEEIELYCFRKLQETTSLDIIHNYISGIGNRYNCCHLDQSLECYNYAKKHLLEKIKELPAKGKVVFFEEDKRSADQIMVIVVHTPKFKGSREHIKLFALFQMMVATDPRLYPTVGYTKYYEFTGKEGTLYINYCTDWILIMYYKT